MLLTIAVSLLAQAPSPTAAETEIERGRLLIRDLYEEKALEVLAPYLDDASLTAPLRARALVYAGIAQMNLGDDAKARETFARALDTDIGAVLPEWVSRKVRVAFDAELERLMKAKKVGPFEPPRVLTRSESHPWVGPTLIAAGIAAGAFGAVCFVRWSDTWNTANGEPVAIDALHEAPVSQRWWVAGEATVVLGAALLIAALAWWLWPQG